jgi:hypothetical protein
MKLKNTQRKIAALAIAAVIMAGISCKPREKCPTYGKTKTEKAHKVSS